MDGTFRTVLQQMISGGLKRFARHVHDSLLANWNSDLRAQQAANAWLPHLLGQGEHRRQPWRPGKKRNRGTSTEA